MSVLGPSGAVTMEPGPPSQPPPPPASHPPVHGWGEVGQPGTYSAAPRPVAPDRRIGCLLRGCGCVPLLFGILMLIGAVVWAGASSIPSDYIQTPGTVSAVRAGSAITNSQGTYYFYLADVSYTVNGRAYMVTAGGQSQATPPSVGDQMTVAYDARNPATAKVVNAPGPSSDDIYFVVAGVVGTLIGLVWLVVGPMWIFAAIDRRLMARRTR